jgi:hypothetical protein
MIVPKFMKFDHTIAVAQRWKHDTAHPGKSTSVSASVGFFE